MKRENWIKLAIVVAVVVTVILTVKYLPIAWTISAIIGFVACGICTYLWRIKLKK